MLDHVYRCTEDQINAFETIFNSLFVEDNKLVVIGGCAGTGKSWMVSRLYDSITQLNEQCMITAVTGKALTKYRNVRRSTIFSLRFEVVHKSNNEKVVVELSPDTLISFNIFFVIVDEASMLSKKDVEWLLDTHENIKIVMFGDLKQLPPISDSFNILDFSDYNMSQIVRTKMDDPIVKMAHDAYNRNIINKRHNNENVKVLNEPLGKVLRNNEYDVIICGTNATRRKVNKFYRQIKGIDSEIPVKGETVVCLKNSYVDEHFLSNGETYKVMDARLCGKDNVLMNLVSCDHNISYSRQIRQVVTKLQYFQEDSYKSSFHDKIQENTNEIPFTFGYCMTVHKTQGSEYESVLFIDEDVSYFLPRNRFRYTAITRAKKVLHILQK